MWSKNVQIAPLTKSIIPLKLLQTSCLTSTPTVQILKLPAPDLLFFHLAFFKTTI